MGIGVGIGIFLGGGGPPIPLTIAPSSLNMMTHTGAFTSSTQTFTAAGGAGGYTFSIVGGALGGETLNSGTGAYVAPTTIDVNPKTRTIRVTDSLGATADATVTVYNQLSISGSSSVNAVAATTYTAVGGSGAGAWGLASTTNTTLDSGGNYQAGDAIGNVDTVQFTDAVGFIVTKSVTIAAFHGEALPNCVACYDGQRGISVSTTVTQWDDQTGSDPTHKNAVQATGANQPTYNAIDAAYNNRTTLGLSGSQWLASGTWTSAQGQPCTVYVVGQLLNSFSGFLVAGAPGGAAVENFSPPTKWEIVAGVVDVPSTVDPGSPAVVAGVFNGASSAIYVNDHLTASGSGNPGSTGFTSIGLGARSDGTLAGAGKLAHAIVYSGTHTAAQRARIFTQLGTFYGIATT